MNNPSHQFNTDNAADNFTVVDITEVKIKSSNSKKQEYKNPKSNNKQSDFKEDI